MIAAHIRATRSLFSGSLAVLLVGCHVDLSGLDDLLNSDPTYVNLPGDRVAAGRFSLVTVAGTDSEGAFLTALDLDDGPSMAVVPLAGGPGCRASTASTYDFYPADPTSALQTFVAVLEPANQSAPVRLHVIDTQCHEALPSVDGANFPFQTGHENEYPGFFTLTTDGRLIFLNPWHSEERTLSNDARTVRFSDDAMWSLEEGQVVVRDLSLRVLGRFGTDVQELVLSSDGSSKAAFRDGVNVYSWTDPTKAPEQIDQDACSVSSPFGFSGLSYRSPCADRQLVLYGTTQSGSTTPTKWVVPSSQSTIGAPTIRSWDGRSFVFFLTNDDATASSGTLWAAPVGGDTIEKLGDGVGLNGAGVPSIVRNGRELWFLTDLTSGVGQLQSWQPEHPVNGVASGVVSLSPPLAIADFDGKVGNLRAITGTSSGVLLRGVPRRGLLTDVSGTAVLTGSDGSSGTLVVAEPKALQFETVAPNVRLGTFSFLGSMPAIGYLHDYDAVSGTGILAFRQIETADVFDAGVRARAWTEIGWPEPSILYTVPNRSSRGVWLARMK